MYFKNTALFSLVIFGLFNKLFSQTLIGTSFHSGSYFRIYPTFKDVRTTTSSWSLGMGIFAKLGNKSKLTVSFEQNRAHMTRNIGPNNDADWGDIQHIRIQNNFIYARYMHLFFEKGPHSLSYAAGAMLSSTQKTKFWLEPNPSNIEYKATVNEGNIRIMAGLVYNYALSERLSFFADGTLLLPLKDRKTSLGLGYSTQNGIYHADFQTGGIALIPLCRVGVELGLFKLKP